MGIKPNLEAGQEPLEFIGQAETLRRLTRLIEDAAERVWLVSPYATLHKLRALTRSIERALSKRVAVHLVVRAPDKSTRHSKEGIVAIRALVDAGLKLFSAGDLHAKIYCSEKHALVTSLNLLDTSFANSIEIGMWVPTSRPEMKGIIAFFEGEIRTHMTMTKPEDLVLLGKDSSGSQASVDPEAIRGDGRERKAERLAKVRTAPAAKAKGYCLRCGERIPLNPDRPYCAVDYEEWAEYGDENYEDVVCHICGCDHPATKRKPLCQDCFEGEA